MAKTINVKIAEVVIPERWRKKETDVTGLANSILELGLMNPIGITKHKVLIHGFRRIAAYKILGRDTIQAIVFDIDENDRGLLEYVENACRENLDWADEVTAKLRLHEEAIERHGAGKPGHPAKGFRGEELWTQEKTAKLIGESEGKISQDLQLAKAIESKPYLCKLQTRELAKKVLAIEAVRDKEQTATVNGECGRMIIGDCTKIIPELSDKFKLVFLDPPYYDLKDLGWKAPDYDILSKILLERLDPNGVIVLCGTQPSITEAHQHLRKYFKLQFEIIWAKTTPGMCISAKKPLPAHENLWIYSEPQHENLHFLIRRDCSLAKTHLDIRRVATGKDRHGSSGCGYAMKLGGTRPLNNVGYPKSVFTSPSISRGSPEYCHGPTQKPEKLVELVISISTERGDSVLDPYLGVGTTAVVCERLQRKWVGIEIDPKTAALAAERIKRIKKELKC